MVNHPVDMVIWLVLLVAFSAAEAVTVGLVSLWFALGSLCALLLSLFIENIWAEIGVFLLVSIATLLLLRPLVDRYFSAKDMKRTNLDLIVGSDGVVLEAIDNLFATGQVKVRGQVWSARSQSGEPIPTGTVITVLRIEGVKVFVQPKESADTL
ncbi:MAG: NfeD family protein [Clostridiales bacterium]|nr:NfeD family protein [Clostridiales bacterium]MCD8142478.1 NfeD family protein [Clostridiales bacterium]